MLAKFGIFKVKSLNVVPKLSASAVAPPSRMVNCATSISFAPPVILVA